MLFPIKLIISVMLSWLLISPSLAAVKKDHMSMSMLGISRGMTLAEVDKSVKAMAGVKTSSLDKYPDKINIKIYTVNFQDGRLLRLGFDPRSQKVGDIDLTYQGGSYKKNLKPLELEGLPKPEFVSEDEVAIQQGWGGKRLIDGDLQPGRKSKGTLLVTHIKGQSISIALYELPY